MEKQGMERRNRPFRPGLLIAIFFFGFLVSHIPAQTRGVLTNPSPEIRTIVSPLTPFVSENFIITILVNHPELSEVIVNPPELPEGMIFERMISEARVVQDQVPVPANGEEPEPWTAVEYLFKADTPLNLELDPFDVTVAGRRIAAGVVKLNVNYRSGWTLYNPVFRWENPPSALAAGEETELVLQLSNWDPQRAPPQKIFSGRVPQNAILEEQPLSDKADGRNIRYRLRLIPLTALSNSQTSVNLEAFSFPYEGNVLYVPRLSIRLAGAEVRSSPLQPANIQPLNIDENEASEPQDIEPFEVPALQPLWPASAVNADEVPGLFRKEYGRVIGSAKEFWDEGRYAKALAELRRGERDSYAGLYFASIRRELEKNLGFSSAEDESWQFWKKMVLFLGVAILFSVVFAVLSRINVTIPGKKGYNSVVFRICAIILVAAFFCGSIALINMSFQSFGSGKKAVLEKTPVYRVPDSKGTQDSYFVEGEVVYVRAVRGDWIYAESAGNSADKAEGKTNGRTGWILKEAAIIY